MQGAPQPKQSGSNPMRRQFEKRVVNYYDQLEGRAASPYSAKRHSPISHRSSQQLDDEEVRIKKLKDLKELMRRELGRERDSPGSVDSHRSRGSNTDRERESNKYESEPGRDDASPSSFEGHLYPLDARSPSEQSKEPTFLQTKTGSDPYDFHMRKSKEIRRLQYSAQTMSPRTAKKEEGYPLWVRINGREIRALMKNADGFRLDEDRKNIEVREKDRVFLVPAPGYTFAGASTSGISGTVEKPRVDEMYCSFVVLTASSVRYPVTISSNCIAYDEAGNEVGRGRVGMKNRRYKGVYFEGNKEPQVVLITRHIGRARSTGPGTTTGKMASSDQSVDISFPYSGKHAMSDMKVLNSEFLPGHNPPLLLQSLANDSVLFLLDCPIMVGQDPVLHRSRAVFSKEDGGNEEGLLEIDRGIWMRIEEERNKRRLRLEVAKEDTGEDIEQLLDKIKSIVEKRNKPKPAAPAHPKGIDIEFDILCPHGDRLRVYISSASIGDEVEKRISAIFVPDSEDPCENSVGFRLSTNDGIIAASTKHVCKNAVLPEQTHLPSDPIIRLVRYDVNKAEEERLRQLEELEARKRREYEDEMRRQRVEEENRKLQQLMQEKAQVEEERRRREEEERKIREHERRMRLEAEERERLRVKKLQREEEEIARRIEEEERKGQEEIQQRKEYEMLLRKRVEAEQRRLKDEERKMKEEEKVRNTERAERIRQLRMEREKREREELEAKRRIQEEGQRRQLKDIEDQARRDQKAREEAEELRLKELEILEAEERKKKAKLDRLSLQKEEERKLAEEMRKIREFDEENKRIADERKRLEEEEKERLIHEEKRKKEDLRKSRDFEEERDRLRREEERRKLDEAERENRIRAEKELHQTRLLVDEAGKQVIKEEEQRIKLRRKEEMADREREIEEDRKRRLLDEERIRQEHEMESTQKKIKELKANLEKKKITESSKSIKQSTHPNSATSTKNKTPSNISAYKNEPAHIRPETNNPAKLNHRTSDVASKPQNESSQSSKIVWSGDKNSSAKVATSSNHKPIFDSMRYEHEAPKYSSGANKSMNSSGEKSQHMGSIGSAGSQPHLAKVSLSMNEGGQEIDFVGYGMVVAHDERLGNKSVEQELQELRSNKSAHASQRGLSKTPSQAVSMFTTELMNSNPYLSQFAPQLAQQQAANTILQGWRYTVFCRRWKELLTSPSPTKELFARYCLFLASLPRGEHNIQTLKLFIITLERAGEIQTADE